MSNYDDWQRGYERSMRGRDQGVGELLSNHYARENGFGGGHAHTEYEVAAEVQADTGADDLSVTMAPAPSIEKNISRDIPGAVPAAAGSLSLVGEVA